MEDWVKKYLVNGDKDEGLEELEELEELGDADGTGESDNNKSSGEQTRGTTGEEPSEEDESEEEAEPLGSTSVASAGKDHQGTAPELSCQSTRLCLFSHSMLVDPESQADNGSSKSDYSATPVIRSHIFILRVLE